MVFFSQQPLVKAFRKHCCSVMFSHIWQKLTDKMKEEHRQAIEEKEAALALISKSQRELSKLKQDTANLQASVGRLERRVVPHLEDTRKDNGMTIIQKHNEDHEYPYIAIYGQQGYVSQKIQHKMIDYPNAQIVVLAETRIR